MSPLRMVLDLTLNLIPSNSNLMKIITPHSSFFYNSSSSAKFWLNPVSINGEKQSKFYQKQLSLWVLNPGPLDHHSNTLLTELRRYVLDK